MQDWFNICKSVYGNDSYKYMLGQNDHMIFSIDTKKALDRVYHSFVISLEVAQWLKALAAKPDRGSQHPERTWEKRTDFRKLPSDFRVHATHTLNKMFEVMGTGKSSKEHMLLSQGTWLCFPAPTSSSK